MDSTQRTLMFLRSELARTELELALNRDINNSCKLILKLQDIKNRITYLEAHPCTQL